MSALTLARPRLAIGEPLRSGAFGLLWVLVATIPVASMTTLGSGATISRAIGLVAAAAGGLAVAATGPRRLWTDAHLLLVALVAWSLCSVLWTQDPGATLERSLTLAQLLVMVLLIWELAEPPARWRALLAAYTAGSAVTSVQLLQAVARDDPLVTGRFSTGGYNPNDLVQVLVLSLPVAAYLAVTATTPARRALAWAHVPLAGLAMLATGSRQALLLLPVGLLGGLMALRRSGRIVRLAAGAVLAAGLAAMAAALPRDTWARLSTAPGELLSGDLGDRATLWGGAVQALEANPVLGIGQGALERVNGQLVGEPLGAHNTFLSVGAELGLVGLTLLVLALLAALIRAGSLTGPERLLGLGVGLTLLASLMPGHNEYDKATWLALAFMLAPVAATAARPGRRHRDREARP